LSRGAQCSICADGGHCGILAVRPEPAR
jgi:hypothetical protein